MIPPMLLLTSWMTPHRIVPWQEALTMLFNKKIVVLEEYDDVDISSTSITIKMPSVAYLRTVVSPYKKGVKFSRINVFTRDGFRCQYCGTKKTMRELNYDHVIPRKLGGETVWRNIVTACYLCNNIKKGGRTPKQAGMKLLKEPVEPKSLPMNALILPDNIPESWAFYCPSLRVAV